MEGLDLFYEGMRSLFSGKIFAVMGLRRPGLTPAHYLVFIAFLSCLGLAAPLHAEVREFTLTVTEGTVDLKGARVPIWTYNGAFPGPEIRVKEGDTVRIKLKNLSGANHGLFFHGLRVGNRIALQEQVPVEPGYEYVYEFSAEPAGTHLYHCAYNMAEHLSRGMYGPFIVEAKDEKKYDKEFVYIISDWNVSDVSGKTMHEAGHPRNTMDSDVTTINDKVVAGDDPLVFEAGVGETVRLRIGNIGHLPHRLRLAGGFLLTHEDGYAIAKPESHEALVIPPGKRYDVVIKAKAAGRRQIYHSTEKPKPFSAAIEGGVSEETRHAEHDGHGAGLEKTKKGLIEEVKEEVAIVMDVKADLRLKR